MDNFKSWISVNWLLNNPKARKKIVVNISPETKTFFEGEGVNKKVLLGRAPPRSPNPYGFI